MVILKSPGEIDKIARASAVVGKVLKAIEAEVKPGVKTIELDRFAEALIREEGAEPAFKGYRGFKATLCTSINEEVVHGIPGERQIKNGDILSIDCGAIIDGYYGDAARTFPVGEIDPEVEDLVRTTAESLDRGIEQMVVGKRLHDISAAIQEHAETHGYSVVREFVGHGIGQNLHEDPPVPNYGKPNTGIKLEAGLVLAIEPMVNMGGPDVKVLADGWTAVTVDGRWSAHFEDTIVITDDGPRILTREIYG